LGNRRAASIRAVYAAGKNSRQPFELFLVAAALGDDGIQAGKKENENDK
jgi:hypothetical protein